MADRCKFALKGISDGSVLAFDLIEIFFLAINELQTSSPHTEQNMFSRTAIPSVSSLSLSAVFEASAESY